MIKYTAVIDTPFARLGIIAADNEITKISYVTDQAPSIKCVPAIIRELEQQILQYIKHPTISFTIPYRLNGTKHQMSLWKILKKIPPGNVETYGNLAELMHSSARAVGNACRQNPLPIIIPCHRVVAKNHIGGYAGDITGENIIIKQWLLANEKNNINST